MAKKKLSNIAPFGLRMQPDLRAKVEIAARTRNVSLNTHIVEQLEQSFEHRRNLSDYTDGELIDELIKRWGRSAVYIQLGNKPEDQ